MERKVIVRSNAPEDAYWIGTYKGKDAKMFDLHVVDNDKGERFHVCGIIVPYSDKLAQWLDTMTPQEQWSTLLDMKRFWSAL